MKIKMKMKLKMVKMVRVMMVKAVLAMSPTDQSSELPIIMMIAGNGWNCENGKEIPQQIGESVSRPSST